MEKYTEKTKQVSSQARRNVYGFGIGTLGRDISYTLVSMYLMFYLTDVIRITGGTLAAVTAVVVVARVFDALSDPVVGLLVDNTATRWGKFKPWIVAGAILTFIFQALLFTDFGIEGAAFVWLFAAIYLAYSISYTANDVGYWSLLPALSQSQKQRDKIGSFARICASLGAFSMVVGIVPISTALTEWVGSESRAYQLLAIIAATLLIVFQAVTVIFTKEERTIPSDYSPTRFKELGKVLFKNDQLVAIAAAMALFTTGYTITISLGLYFFKYVYGDEAMYSIFALVLGISQISAMAVYPAVTQRISRKRLFLVSMILVVTGYIIFFLAPTTTMLFIGVAGVLIFVGQAWIQVLILLFIADTVEYGQWKLGRRNESITFAVQPFINKLGAALASGVVGTTVLLAHTQEVPTGQVLQGSHLLVFKLAMIGLPLLLIAGSYLVYRRFYRIDAEFYTRIIADLKARER